MLDRQMTSYNFVKLKRKETKKGRKEQRKETHLMTQMPLKT